MREFITASFVFFLFSLAVAGLCGVIHFLIAWVASIFKVFKISEDIKRMNSYARLGLILAIQAEIEGMKAENKACELLGKTIPFIKADFDAKAEELRGVAYKHEDIL
jgi:hypothetical protein